MSRTKMERRETATGGNTREIYNLRSRVVSIASHNRVSTVQREETAVDKLPYQDEEVCKQSKSQKVETAIGKKPGIDEVVTKLPPPREYECRGPPPMTGRLLKNFLLQKQREVRELATKALYWYNRDSRQRGLPTYKLVETLGLEGCVLKRGLVRHFNFKAQPKDDHPAAAPPELFFGERVVSWRGLKETRCYKMGTESPEPGTVGCKACKLCAKIFHPIRGEKFYGAVVVG